MIDDRTLAEAFHKAKAADRMRVPPLPAILARAECAREMQNRRRFTAAMWCASALAGAGTLCAIVLAPGGFPLAMSPSIAVVLAPGLVAALWGLAPARTALQ
ncbi:MAG TPA: hypothetical protein VFV78_04000 [Vicinamibacterales bacterium]|nr:hypothetical protein [Vicinamibacterales bacterium]